MTERPNHPTDQQKNQPTNQPTGILLVSPKSKTKQHSTPHHFPNRAMQKKTMQRILSLHNRSMQFLYPNDRNARGNAKTMQENKNKIKGEVREERTSSIPERKESRQ